MRRFVFQNILTVVVFVAPATLFAQVEPAAIANLIGGGAVSGHGTAQIEHDPEFMRLQIAILARSATLKDALTDLKDRIEAARLQVTAMGADKDSIKIGEPELSTTKSDRQRQMEQMIRQQMRASGRKRNASKTVSPINVSATLTAQWPLNGNNAEELLIEIHELQEKIKAADLAGSEEASKLSAAEQEILEELQDSGYDPYGNDSESKPGTPIFTFVSTISKEEYDQATAAAFKKAKDQAERLAQAAGATLGPLKSISSNPASDDNSGYGMYGAYDAYYYRMMQMNIASRQASDEATPEAIGMKPGKVKYGIQVNAAFALKEK